MRKPELSFVRQLFGPELAGLPPVLVQASEAEILIDDARRYVNKARAAGSPVELETWHGGHLLQFGRRDKFRRIGHFLDAHGLTRRAPR